MLEIEALRDELVSVANVVGEHKEVAEATKHSSSFVAQLRHGTNVKDIRTTSGCFSFEFFGNAGPKKILFGSSKSSSPSPHKCNGNSGARNRGPDRRGSSCFPLGMAPTFAALCGVVLRLSDFLHWFRCVRSKEG